MRWNRRTFITILFILLAISYVVLTLTLPPDAHTLTKYNLTPSQAKQLSLTVALPYVAIWFAALYGSLKFKVYTSAINRSSDGRGLASIANGLLTLAFSLPIVTIASNLATYESNKHPSTRPTMTILSNYLSLVILLGAFYLIFRGAKQLKKVLLTYRDNLPRAEVLPLLFIVLSVTTAYLTMHNPARQHPAGAAHVASYYLSDWWLLVTIVLPYIIVWYIGFTAVWYIRLYAQLVPGVLYRRALSYVANGIFIIVLSQMVLRLLTSLNGWLENRTLKFLLLLIYVLLIIIGSGYIVIVRGSKKLAKIEEVI